MTSPVLAGIDAAAGMTAQEPVLDEVLDGAEVIVCCGSGGVGKPTTAAVIGLEATAAGTQPSS